jgi:hypothetical protein
MVCSLDRAYEIEDVPICSAECKVAGSHHDKFIAVWLSPAEMMVFRMSKWYLLVLVLYCWRIFCIWEYKLV